MGVVEPVYREEVLLNEPETAKPLRVVPAFVKARVKGKPPGIVTE